MVFLAIKSHIKTNTLVGLQTKPSFSPLHVILPCTLYAGVALSYGLVSDLFEFKSIQSEFIFILPLTLFLFPSLLEEIIFRGFIIPIDAKEKEWRKKSSYILLSTSLFVLWHPFNASMVNKGAQEYFFDIRFLLVVTLLGLVCSYTYVYSKSIWIPTIIHWLTVVVWVFLLGGRNLLLELE
uniref:CAAX protease self-immunity n=1 Tax=Candidatus Kentrum sp. FW TaxID=2126338 RepID=A0A450STS3_9GAMM|nr:MAG: CAAX protease self-immunity [Candidatus Kentron sp. FW]VFJ58030.1 MAG: CAAX protease self-immunity [Candidatus Kentron sp. FW]